jgi:hypothetical protein
MLCSDSAPPIEVPPQFEAHGQTRGLVSPSCTYEMVLLSWEQHVVVAQQIYSRPGNDRPLGTAQS